MLQRPTLICDLDNTLYDWVGYYVPSFYAMLDCAVRVLECDREALLDQFQRVHQKHHNSEHPYALLETPIAQKWLNENGNRPDLLNTVFHAFNSERKKRLVTYPDVHATLKLLKKNGVLLIAHSDSNILAVIDRLNRLDLTSYFELIYCINRSEIKHPFGRPFSKIYNDFPWDRVHLLRPDERKPNPEIIQHIIHENNLDTHKIAYVGDSMAKDIVMARRAGIKTIWAKYGTHVDATLYSKLIRISHWTEADVKREKKLNAAVGDTKPDFICNVGFSDLLAAYPLFCSNLTLDNC